MTDLIDEIRREQDRGASYGEIASRLGITRNQVAGHLYRDRVSGRSRCPGQTFGERHSKAKLTERDVRAIRRMRASGMLLREISAQVGVHWNTIGHICARRTWKHTPATENDDG